MVLRDVASRSSSSGDRGRRGRPLGLVGLAVLVALVAAYLSDCIPGLGTGGSGTPRSEAPASADPAPTEPASAEPASAEDSSDRLSIVVQGDRCRRGEAAAAPCPELCAGIDRSRAASIRVEIDATRGSHGAVEALRACLQEAGFSDVHVRSE